ncbi:MAG: monovalent cation/H(+) antiporter subunit G [Alphaproteobacteria bacterium]|nr:monovalent cation/H(+) antiporter subunit G [Alphaproteobacteria bacterium]
MEAVLQTMAGPLTVADWISWICIGSGVFFAFTGAVAILRLPGVFSRMHGAGMIDTMGLGLILTGLMVQAEEPIVIVKLALILAFVFFTSPTTTFALARAAIHGGVDPAAGPTPKADPAPAQPEETDPSRT